MLCYLTGFPDLFCQMNLRRLGFALAILLEKVERLALAPIYLKLLHAKLDEWVGSIMRYIGH